MNVVDPTGSGDAFAAGLITGIVRGYDLPETLACAAPWRLRHPCHRNHRRRIHRR